LAFLDESGFLLVPTIARAWAPRGKTPILLPAGSWTKISAVSAITISPKHRHLGLYCRFHPNKNFRAPQVVEFLAHMLQHVRGHVVLLWDRRLPHRAVFVARFLRHHPRLHVHLLPPYAPELNPDEHVWRQMKRSLANSLPKDIRHLRRQLDRPLHRLQRSQRLLWSCIRASELPWAKRVSIN
jgi:putative transposase